MNRAWVRRWNIVIEGRFKARDIIITPSWLKVDKAIIFFRSISSIAVIPAISIVRVAVIKSILLKIGAVLREG